MRLLLDIKVLFDVTLQRPGAPASAQILGLCSGQHEAWLAWHSVATLIARTPKAFLRQYPVSPP